MTEGEARDWCAARFGDAAVDRLSRFVDMVIDETARQNLVAVSSLPDIWTRHVIDSAQLSVVDGRSEGMWLDVGTGAGFPGLVIALLIDRPFTLSEPRRLRANFLQQAVDTLDIGARVTVVATKVENLAVRAATISARAVAPLETLLRNAAHCSVSETLWLLPRGASGRDEVQRLNRRNRAMFHVEQSITDADAVIAVGRGKPVL